MPKVTTQLLTCDMYLKKIEIPVPSSLYRFSFLSHYNLLSSFSSLFNEGEKLWQTIQRMRNARKELRIFHSYALFLSFFICSNYQDFSFFPFPIFLLQGSYIKSDVVVVQGGFKKMKEEEKKTKTSGRQKQFEY